MTFPTSGKNERYPQGHVIQGWGENRDLYHSVNPNLNGHPGIDIVPDVSYGQPIFSPTDAVVVAVDYKQAGYGHEVALLQEGCGWQLLSFLGHLTEQQIVQVGERVKEGQVVGYMGNSGFVVSGGVRYWGDANPDKKGTHLHWRTCWLKEVPLGEPSNTSYLGKNYIIKDFGNGFDNSFDPLTLFRKETMVGFKKEGDMTVYIAVGNYLVPIADWQAFLNIGGYEAGIIELDDSEFAKFTVSTNTLFKSA